MELFFFLKPTCSSLSVCCLSMNQFRCAMTILAWIFARTDVNAMGQYDVCKFVGLPVFRKGVIIALAHSCGILLLDVQIMLFIVSRVLGVFGPRCFMNSGKMLSGPGCFFDFVFLMASLSSSFVNSLLNISSDVLYTVLLSFF